MRTVHVIYHYEEGSWWAESPDVIGWSAAGATFAEISANVAEGLEFFLDERVQVVEMITGDAALVAPATCGAILTNVSFSELSPPAKYVGRPTEYDVTGWREPAAV
jgi:predicted RNase H-like HicB family nuclease